MSPETVFDGSSIPQWASDLRVSVAKIEGRTEQIPELVTRLEELRANTVPMTEHLQLMRRVQELWDRDLSARGDWEELVPHVRDLWNERLERRGAINAYRVWLAALSVVVTVLTMFVLLRDIGVNVSVK